jgi:type II secretory pathway pseudopilin PulG
MKTQVGGATETQSVRATHGRKRPDGGFTMVEGMAIIVIVAIVATVILFALGSN